MKQEIKRKLKGTSSIVVMVTAMVFTAACTEETRNKIGRSTDNFLGEDLRVSYIDGGTVVKSWTVKDGKITSGKDANGGTASYYYFWSVETGYVQIPIERTIIEEIKNP